MAEKKAKPAKKVATARPKGRKSPRLVPKEEKGE